LSIFSFLKGWTGETMGAIAHWASLDKAIYTSLNNLTLRTLNGTTQIDHVIVSRFGIFVVEAKNIDGWIFGDANSPQWTVVKVGRKYRIQNPLHQNYRHVRTVVEHLGVDQSKVHSLVMFWGDCDFKTQMPPNVLRSGYAAYLKSFSEPIFTQREVVALIEALRSGALPKSWSTHREHLASLKDRHQSTTRCPKCGASLILRTAKTGVNAGRRFYGCSGYPKCKHTAPYVGDT
jgi:restriction system protein